MSQTGASGQSALMAHQILTAMQRGNLVELECGLERAERLASSSNTLEPAVGEQLELLGAVAGQMRHSISRFGRNLTPHLEGMEVPLRLLYHLAAKPASLAAPCSHNAAASVS